MTTTTAPSLLEAAVPSPMPNGSTARTPQVEIVVPVYNEEAVLPRSIRRLHSYLLAHFPFSWRITIADNASTDGTMSVARELAWELPGVNLVHLDQKGRGRALRSAWSGSDAEVVSYMDVDLSTDLRGLLPLVAPLMSGHSDLAIGSRLARGSQVVRGPKREFISRTYNHILRTTVRARFSDAQCGFKAGRTDVLRDLLPRVRDDAWFFDTELLVLAQRSGLRIHEVPVDWVDDPDSRVDIVSTAVADLRGVARLVAASAPARFVAIGMTSTLAFAAIYLGLRELMAAQLANALGLAITAVGNTAANRRFTFGVRGRARLLRDHAYGLAIWAATVAITGASLLLLDAAVADPRRALELAVLVAASATATVTRYLALRFWVFARRGRAVPSS